MTATATETRQPMEQMDDDQRWQAVLAHDPNADGRFYYAVRSTGIYCRPSCPARRPQRGNVGFFADADAAERAGYRPCRRCHPRDGGADAASREAVLRACALIAARDTVPTLAELGAHVGLSPAHLQRVFTQAMGVSPRRYAAARRLDRAKERLQGGDSVTTALYGAGYGSARGFYEQAPDQLGMPPAVYRNGGRGQRLAYTLVASRLGRLLIAATARGICAVRIGEPNEDEALVAALRAEFPAAAIERDDALLAPEASVLLDHLAGRRLDLDLPLDVQGTAFQARVWAALRAIPRGETRSYSQVAAAIGAPTAARAVARACATNPVALVVPCHRVVGADGSLAGYRWGVERKRRLLDSEGAAVADQPIGHPPSLTSLQ